VLNAQAPTTPGRDGKPDNSDALLVDAQHFARHLHLHLEEFELLLVNLFEGTNLVCIEELT
jgi:hypothetical protein